MKSLLLATTMCVSFAMGAIAAPVYTSTVQVGYDPAAPTSNFGSPGTNSEITAYEVRTGQDSQNVYVNLVAVGSQASNALPFANIYFGGNTSVGIEVTNERAFRPGFPGYYDLSSYTGYSFTSAPGNIAFSLAFSFFTDDPLGIGFNQLSDQPGSNFLRVSLSQTFGYAVAGGQANYGTDRLGAFIVPAVTAVPEPASLALLGVGLAGLSIVRRRRAQARQIA